VLASVRRVIQRSNIRAGRWRQTRARGMLQQVLFAYTDAIKQPFVDMFPVILATAMRRRVNESVWFTWLSGFILWCA
jgi:hypothetical protein